MKTKNKIYFVTTKYVLLEARPLVFNGKPDVCLSPAHIFGKCVVILPDLFPSKVSMSNNKTSMLIANYKVPHKLLQDMIQSSCSPDKDHKIKFRHKIL